MSKIMIGVAVSLVIGLIAQAVLIYSSIQVLSERVKILNDGMITIRENVNKLNAATVDRWTRANHQNYADKMDTRLEKLQARIRELEKHCYRQKK